MRKLRLLWRALWAKPPVKSVILTLKVTTLWTDEGPRPVQSWTFEGNARDETDPITGESLMNGYTNAELNEIARRRSEWGL